MITPTTVSDVPAAAIINSSNSGDLIGFFAPVKKIRFTDFFSALQVKMNC